MTTFDKDTAAGELEPVDPTAADAPTPSWDEWVADNGGGWPDGSEALDQFRRIP